MLLSSLNSNSSIIYRLSFAIVTVICVHQTEFLKPVDFSLDAKKKKKNKQNSCRNKERIVAHFQKE